MSEALDKAGVNALKKVVTAVRKKRKKPVEDGTFVDMVAFAALMTILLAFFIMLSSNVGPIKEEAANEAINSFKEAIGNFGINKMVFGRSDSVANLSLKQNNFNGKSKEKNQLGQNDFANTIDKEIDIDYEQTGNQIVIPTEINFVNEKMELSSESKIYLNSLIKVIKNRDCKILVGGYTAADFVPSGDFQTSWQQSAEYASVVTKYFNNVGNIHHKRLTAVGYGKYQPLLSNAPSSKTVAKNRIRIIVSDR
ncbi:MAG: OmpA family protein [Candidatus Scalindua sp.]|jgi:chemotaxis protein MotB|nr:OmpA family protein [Candidatus Scalindua sp.]MBT6562463.1 OmpA family protein [Candidatus Scalindua sp.]